MKYQLILFLTLFYSANTLALGQTGHRITGNIAENYLTEKTKKTLTKILGNESLAEVSNYADEMRSNPDDFWQTQASHYHYVTVPKGKLYRDIGAPEQGDAVFALNKYSQIVRDPLASMADKRLSIKFIVHLIGDLHQPLHVGNGTDRGGNDVKVKFFGRDNNLHRVWDNGMLDRKQLSFTEWSTWLNRQISEKDVIQWSEIDPHVWIKESAAIRDKIYPAPPSPGEFPSLKYQYLYNNLPILKLRLKQAGVRIAAYLNELLKTQD